MKEIPFNKLQATTKGWYPLIKYTFVVVLFALIATAYFVPATFEGRELFQVDVAGVSGNGSDVQAHNEEHPDTPSYWTNSLFGGMPMYQIAPSYPSTKTIAAVEQSYTLQWPFKILGSYPWMLFALMLGFFIFLKSMEVKSLPAIFGAVMWAFSSYYVILISAGHIWKLMALSYIPPTIAGLVWVYRGKYLQGAAVLAFFTAIQLLANHVQMTYYFLFVMLAMLVGWLIEAIRTKQYKHFFMATAIALAAGGIGIAINSTNLYHTYRYSKETMRGGSELTLPLPGQEGTNSAKEVNQKGLDKSYITQWSYGIGETWSLLVPNIRGGASEALGKDPEKLASVKPQLRNAVAEWKAYWGNQPFTSGPVYVGVFVVMLFLLGCFLVKGPMKWALLTLTLLSILLSWGKNFMPLTNFFIDYIPLYGKFRAVSSILVVAEFTIPALAVLGLVELLRDPSVFKRRPALQIIVFGIPLFFILLMALFPNLFGNFLSNGEASWFNQMELKDPNYGQFREELRAVRRAMLVTDAWRAIVFSVLSIVCLFFFTKGKLKAPIFVVLIGLISLIDLWSVDKRYLNDEMFVPKEQIIAQTAIPTEADELIMRDKEAGYRVLNLSVDPFNDASTSRWHLSVGGYHAAKLQRYQDLITHQLSKLNPQVVNMLNTRYIIFRDQKTKQLGVERNYDAFGAAWFAHNISIVPDANSEMKALDNANLRETAVVDSRFATPELKALRPLTDSTASIAIKTYAPNEAIYNVNLGQPALALFSEIYYPDGWKATLLDDKGIEFPIIRANYVLRGIVLPSGNYQLRMYFDPDSIHVTEAIAYTALTLLLLLVISAALMPLLRKKLKHPKSSENIIVNKTNSTRK